MSSFRDSPRFAPQRSSARDVSPATSHPRRGSTSIQRVGSPAPSTQSHAFGTPSVRQIPTPSQLASTGPYGGGPNDSESNIAPLSLNERSKVPSASPRGESALAQALKGADSPPRFSGTPPPRAMSPAQAASQSAAPRSNYGSFDPKAGGGFLKEDLDVVKRHLAGPMALSSSPGRKVSAADGGEGPVNTGLDEDEFSSLRLQGGDVTRQIYRFVEQQSAEQHGPARRKSFTAADRPALAGDTMNANVIKTPGGFRRDYIRRTVAASPAPSSRIGLPESSAAGAARVEPQILTTNFIEFLSLYGHFAGEELEDEEYDESDDYYASETFGEDVTGDEGSDGEPGERSALLSSRQKKKRTKRKEAGHGATPKGAALLLLKSFVGTGVLFLPKAFLNGGMLFSFLVLLFVAALSYYCFLLLVSVRIAVPASFGGMGYKLYGTPMRALINFSLVISQIGFSSAYIVFVSENLRAFVQAVSKCKTDIPITYFILMQMVVFLPLSLYRNIQNIQKIAIVADVFILLGLVYLYYFDIFTIVQQHGIADIKLFNPSDWTLFIGTAIFTFEGIGLIIPIQESMANPKRFPPVLGGVMILISVVFISMGALSYAAYGSHTKTVVILNMPQDSKFVNGVQFIYSLAILLSTPLQFFPAIEITSQAIFKKSASGRNDPRVKWEKNVFRFFMVVLCALIAWIGADDLDKFVALVGSFACVPLVYIYPPMLHYRAISKNWRQRALDITLIIFGFAVMGYTTVLTVMSWIAGSGSKEKGFCDKQ